MKSWVEDHPPPTQPRIYLVDKNVKIGTTPLFWNNWRHWWWDLRFERYKSGHFSLISISLMGLATAKTTWIVCYSKINPTTTLNATAIFLCCLVTYINIDQLTSWKWWKFSFSLKQLAGKRRKDLLVSGGSNSVSSLSYLRTMAALVLS